MTRLSTKNEKYNKKNIHLAITAALFALAATPATVVAQAGDNDENRPGAIEEIIVTAQRREQTLQEVPMAISAFTEEELAYLQADNLDSLQGAVPNLNLVQGRGSNSSANVYIRGVGQPDALQSFDPAVGIYLDDVYMSRIQGGLFKLYDIERIEVLRGPQGTLYGKNTPGGAIRLITRTPGDDFEAQAGLLVGDYGRIQARARLSGPLTDDFALGVSVLHDERDGFVTDPATGREYNDEDTTVFRMKGNWEVNDDFSVVFSADYTKEDVNLTLGRSETLLYSLNYTADFSGFTIVPRSPAPIGEWDYKTSTSMTDRPTQETDHWGVNVTLNWDINADTSLRSITAYRDLETASFIDIDATVLELGDVFVGVDQNQFSQEFQLLGNNGSDVNWVLGAYYLKEEVPSHQEAYADDFLQYVGFPITFLRTIDDNLETTSYALFGQVDWAFADNWSMGVGLRWTKEEKDYFRTTSTFSNILGVADPAFAFDDSDSWSDWTPTFTLDYTLSDEVRFYGRLAKGFKSGGFNGRANSAADVSTFDPETVWTAEIGAKTIMADGRVRANYALFYSQYDDFQARVSVGDGIDFRFPVLNAAELEIKGAEFELSWLPIDPLALSTQIGYLDSKYGAGGFFGSDFVEDEPAFSPKWTARFAGTWTQGLANGSDLMFTASASFRDAMWLSVENVPALTESDYWVADAMISWVSEGGKWTVSGGVKNLTDEVYRVEGQEFRSVGGILTAYYGHPRTYTIGVDYRF
ncbi:MAG: TonB-dependent receptor [Xanthomonadales bacterium]|nr:TonB-dependent receptor [Gammaproteobacteria bacterium]NNL05989.1 TonB-dependent receptor [Xanthomonadales bacterium]